MNVLHTQRHFREARSLRQAITLLAALFLCGPIAAAAQPPSGVPLGGETRVWTVDGRYVERQMYLLNLRADTLVLKDVHTGATAQLRRTSIARLDVFRPGRPRRERANLYAGYASIGGAVIGAALPSNSLAATRVESAFLSGLGCAAVGWVVGLALPNGRWYRVMP
jgi:hypothetical protein